MPRQTSVTFGVAEQYEFDVSLASAHLLGAVAVAIAQDATKQKILEIINSNLDATDENSLVVEMCERILERVMVGFRGYWQTWSLIVSISEKYLDALKQIGDWSIVSVYLLIQQSVSACSQIT